MESSTSKKLIDALSVIAGRPLRTAPDYEFLSDIIKARTKQYVSATTLKRLDGYLTEPVVARKSTLNILSQALGYKDFSDFEQTYDRATPDSNPACGRYIDSSLQAVGCVLRLAWRPDRTCSMRYLGENQWIVTEAKNTRLHVGQKLICHYFIDHEPLQLQLIADPSDPDSLNGTYICGRTHGVTLMD